MGYKYPYEADRVANALWADSDGSIDNYDSFSEYFNEFIAEDGKPTSRQQSKLKPEVWRRLRETHKTIKAKKVSVVRGKPQVSAIKPKFSYVGTQKEAVRYARLDYITYKGKQYKRYRDAKGRFVSVQ